MLGAPECGYGQIAVNVGSIFTGSGNFGWYLSTDNATANGIPKLPGPICCAASLFTAMVPAKCNTECHGKISCWGWRNKAVIPRKVWERMTVSPWMFHQDCPSYSLKQSDEQSFLLPSPTNQRIEKRTPIIPLFVLLLPEYRAIIWCELCNQTAILLFLNLFSTIFSNIIPVFVL